MSDEHPGAADLREWAKQAKMEWPELRGQSVEQALETLRIETALDPVRPNIIVAEHPRVGGGFGGPPLAVVVEFKWQGLLPPRKVVEGVYRTSS